MDYFKPDRIRARLYPTHRIRSFSGGTKLVWEYSVEVEGYSILTDNTGSYELMCNEAREAVAVARRVYLAGHRLDGDFDARWDGRPADVL